MDIIQSVWIGAPLSKLEQLAIKSYLANGHEFHLYVYEDVGAVPAGTVVKDANEILDKSEIFYYQNGSIAAFSNLFRWTLLYKKGGYWTDMDCVCVRPFKYDVPFVISSEPSIDYKTTVINCGLLKFPAGGPEAELGVSIQRLHKPDILSGKIQWGSGLTTTDEVVKKFGLEKYVLPWQAICSCNGRDFRTLLFPTWRALPQAIRSLNNLPTEMVCIHFYNELFRRQRLDKNGRFAPNSMFEILKKNYGI